jgi:hypothetical protein
MTYTQQPSGAKLNRYNGIHYDLVGRIGDIARRAFYPQQAGTLKKEEVQKLNSELEHIAEKMEIVNTWLDTAAKRAAAAG